MRAAADRELRRRLLPRCPPKNTTRRWARGTAAGSNMSGGDGGSRVSGGGTKPEPAVAAAAPPKPMNQKQAKLEAMVQRPGGKRSGEVWTVFQAADADGGGTVDHGEIAGMCKKLGVRLTEEELDAAVRSMDGDGNGTVEYDEFYNWWGSDAGIAIRRRLTRPDAMNGPVEGSSAVPAIDPKLVKQLKMHQLTKVESRTRHGQTFQLEKMPVELTVSCKNLATMEETGGNMSVFAVLRTWNPNKEWWAEHGRTETLRENSPQFALSFLLDYVDHDDDYSSEFTQWIKIELYQRKSQMSDLAIHVKQGEMVFSLRSIYRTPVFRTSSEIETGGAMTVRGMRQRPATASYLYLGLPGRAPTAASFLTGPPAIANVCVRRCECSRCQRRPRRSAASS